MFGVMKGLENMVASENKELSNLVTLSDDFMIFFCMNIKKQPNNISPKVAKIKQINLSINY